MKTKQNVRRMLVISIVVISVILSILIGCAIYLNIMGRECLLPAQTADPGTSGPKNVSTQPMEQTGAAAEDIAVCAEFCTLYFPGRWKDQIRTETVESDDGETVVFYGTVGGKEAKLFAVLFNRISNDVGSPVGVLAVNGAPVFVNVELTEIVTDDTWSAEEADTVIAMQESINDILERLEEDPDYSPL